MRKLILALSICALVPCVCIAVAHAEDDAEEFVEVQEIRAVGKRMTCDDIKQEINSLSARDDLDEEEAARLDKLKADQRSKCMQKGAGRRTIPKRKVASSVTAPAEVEEVVEIPSQVDVGANCDTPDANGCCPGETYKDLGDAGFNCCTENDEHCFPPMAVASEKQLCDNGAEPDKNGCCEGETYTDLGDQGFNCCLGDGVTCFPPMGK